MRRVGCPAAEDGLILREDFRPGIAERRGIDPDEYPKRRIELPSYRHSATIFLRIAYSLGWRRAEASVRPRRSRSKIKKIGAPRPMKMGNILSP